MAIQNHAKRPAWVAAKMDAQVQARTGISRHNTELVICGVPVAELRSPEIVRERFYCVKTGHKKSGAPRYHTLEFTLVRFMFKAKNGAWWTALRCQTHDRDRGYCVSVTGFWNLQSAEVKNAKRV